MSNPRRQKNVDEAPNGAYYQDYFNAFYPQQVPTEYYQQQGYYPSQTYNEPTYTNQTPYRVQNRTTNDLFVDDPLRNLLVGKNNFLMSTMSALQQQQIKRVIPKVIQDYHTLHPLDNLLKIGPSRGLGGIISECYKAVGGRGQGVVLRRVINSNTTLDANRIKRIEMWGSIIHPNIVSLSDVITTNVFSTNQQDAVFIYDLFYGCETLEKMIQQYSYTLQEDLIWSYVVQITSALREIHQIGAYETGFELSKILVSSNKRLKLNCIGLVDIMRQEALSEEALEASKDKDLKDFGDMLQKIVCQSNTITLEQARSIYSADLVDLVEYLTQEKMRDMNYIVSMISVRIMNEMTSVQDYNDYLEDGLTKELDNGRLFKLISKIDYVTQHVEKLCMPVQNGTSTITKTDGQVLILFRDYLFHQSPPDFGWIVDTLNKLEVGSTERILLRSRDEQTLLVVEYKDVKKCISAGFAELTKQYDI